MDHANVAGEYLAGHGFALPQRRVAPQSARGFFMELHPVNSERHKGVALAHSLIGKKTGAADDGEDGVDQPGVEPVGFEIISLLRHTELGQGLIIFPPHALDPAEARAEIETEAARVRIEIFLAHTLDAARLNCGDIKLAILSRKRSGLAWRNRSGGVYAPRAVFHLGTGA